MDDVVCCSPVHLFSLGDDVERKDLDTDLVLTKLREFKPELVKQFGVTSLSLYGVYTPEDTGQFYDIDLMVTLDRPATSRILNGVEHYIEDRMGIKVGVITKRSLSEERRRLFEEIAIDV